MALVQVSTESAVRAAVLTVLRDAFGSDRVSEQPVEALEWQPEAARRARLHVSLEAGSDDPYDGRRASPAGDIRAQSSLRIAAYVMAAAAPSGDAYTRALDLARAVSSAILVSLPPGLRAGAVARRVTQPTPEAIRVEVAFDIEHRAPLSPPSPWPAP
jgi:hypothetical protein